jgi:hypothetical protein
VNNLFTEDGSEFWNNGHLLHRIDGPAVRWANGGHSWYVSGALYVTNESYQKAAGLSDEDMTLLVLKYGNVK